MSILDALKQLITKRGGTAKGSNIAEVINNYANEDSPSPSGGSGLVIGVTYDYGGERWIFDKTWKEIRDAMAAGINCVIYREESEYAFTGGHAMVVLEVYFSQEKYYISFVNCFARPSPFIDFAKTNSENDYPYVDF